MVFFFNLQGEHPKQHGKVIMIRFLMGICPGKIHSRMKDLYRQPPHRPAVHHPGKQGQQPFALWDSDNKPFRHSALSGLRAFIVQRFRDPAASLFFYSFRTYARHI
jgi:hypothetical protein